MLKHAHRPRLTSALVLALVLAMAWPGGLVAAWAKSAPKTKPAYASGRFLVKFKPGTKGAKIAAINRANRVKEKSRIARIDVRVLNVPKGKTVEQMVARYQKNPNVEFAEVDAYATLAMTPNDPMFNQQGQSVRIGLPGAWDITRGAKEVTIAILDSGIDMTHPDLQGRFVAGYDFGSSDADPSDTNGHGTAVAGIAAENGNNSLGYAGANWVSPIMPVKVGGSDGTIASSASAAGIVFAADHGARVANMSYSGTSYSSSVKNAIDYALGKGMFLCASSGNTGAEGIRYPAGYPGVVGVGSVNASAVSSFSTYGAHVDVVAPGEGIGTTCLPTTTSTGSRYFAFAGTSAATPYVAGLASLVLSANPGLTGAQVADIIQTTATEFGAAGWDKYYGWGRIDAAAAVRAAAGAQPETTAPTAPEVPSEPVATAPSAPAPVQTDTDAPVVTLTTPTDGSKVSGTVVVKANASDDNAVALVEFWMNGKLLGTDASAPYSVSWNTAKTANGQYPVYARAADASGKSATSSQFIVTVANATKGKAK